ncbi:MAG TPA: bifunctional oligoribonuclease/PAP phosphatase NrnA [Solirubrobacteraceae bacterium]|jgi:phosphoesterase RecJ-like protein|nr:bifunctional oligoribonuclease/PAP phosphatase NrnA [Solirubrobacteraceae bacterium]
MSETDTLATRAAVVEELLSGEHFLLATHENLDGDALGSLVAMQEILSELGKDSIMFIADSELPLPHEYRFMMLNGLVSAIPEDLADRTIVFLDCGNIDRNPAHVLRAGTRLINIDHHHDNTRFGTLNHVVPEASCTAEIVWDLMPGLGVEPTQAIAEALYVGLVTDTGRFMYENTGPRAHTMAAELIEAGVDVAEMFSRLYEGIPLAKLKLFARALQDVTRYDDGRLTLTRLTVEDYRASEAEESHSEGLIDLLRSVEGTKVAVLVRDMLSEGRAGRRKVSLRSTDGEVDVSAIAREQGGGGHRQAAGFQTELATDELIEFLREQICAQLAPAAL